MRSRDRNYLARMWTALLNVLRDNGMPDVILFNVSIPTQLGRQHPQAH
jgi:hypothetical protein